MVRETEDKRNQIPVGEVRGNNYLFISDGLSGV